MRGWPTTRSSPTGSVSWSQTSPALTEKRMFGGLAFLIGGNMSVSASGQGGLLLRVDPDQTGSLLVTAARASRS